MLTIQVVLVVYASDCFTLAASTVGISSVLSTAKKVVLGLSDARDYQLMVSYWSLVAALDCSGARHCGKFVVSCKMYLPGCLHFLGSP